MKKQMNGDEKYRLCIFQAIQDMRQLRAGIFSIKYYIS